MKYSNKIIFWDYFVALVFIFTTNSIIWFQYVTPGIAHVFFFTIALINVFISSHKKSLMTFDKSFLQYFILVFVICVFGMAITYGKLEENSMSGYLIGMISSYLVISRYDFYYFRKLITNIVFLIVLFGIPVFIMNEMGLLPLQRINQYEMFYIYSIGWPYHFHRFAGIWHEPGACQIVLNSVLWLHIYEIRNRIYTKREFLKLIVILIGVLFTLSTGGYLVLMLFLFTCIWKLKLKRNIRYKIYPLLFIFVFAAIYFMIGSNIIQDKFTDENTSFIGRSSDTFALLQMTLERPFLGYGLGTEKFWYRSAELGNTTCSNGLLTGSASLGIIWCVCFIIVVYKNIKRMELGVPALFVLIAFLLMQSNERYLEYPITFLFVFPFYSYKRTKNVNEKSINYNCNSNVQLCNFT